MKNKKSPVTWIPLLLRIPRKLPITMDLCSLGSQTREDSFINIRKMPRARCSSVARARQRPIKNLFVFDAMLHSQFCTSTARLTRKVIAENGSNEILLWKGTVSVPYLKNRCRLQAAPRKKDDHGSQKMSNALKKNQ